MTKLRRRGERIRQFILDNVTDHPGDIAGITAAKFKITRQAVGKHIKFLLEERALVREGQTRAIRYRLHPIVEKFLIFPITKELAEDVVWRKSIEPLLAPMPDNVMELWVYGFTEMFNNAIEHSEGTQVSVRIHKTAVETRLSIHDDGIGIFKKIQAAAGLADERHAVLELAKGKFTTDPERHTGEGIFFTSRMFDDFNILSGETYFSHEFGEEEDWILQNHGPEKGTGVWMTGSNHTSRTLKQVFDKYSSGEDYGFTRTIVPVRMTQYGDDLLVSRSQAKRLLARVDRFKYVLLDFDGVDKIGQAFADEVFRVFPLAHPETAIHHAKANPEVMKMIRRARSNA